MITHFQTSKHIRQPESKGTGNHISRKKKLAKFRAPTRPTQYDLTSFFFCWNVGAFLF